RTFRSPRCKRRFPKAPEAPAAPDRPWPPPAPSPLPIPSVPSVLRAPSAPPLRSFPDRPWLPPVPPAPSSPPAPAIPPTPSVPAPPWLPAAPGLLFPPSPPAARQDQESHPNSGYKPFHKAPQSAARSSQLRYASFFSSLPSHPKQLLKRLGKLSVCIVAEGG